jgi:hypothetical protein
MEAESTVALDVAVGKLIEWREAEREIAALEQVAKKLKGEVREALRSCGADGGTICGVTVVTRKATNTFRGAQFKKDRPDLAGQYTTVISREELDVESLKRDHPDIATQYLAEALKPSWKELDAALKGGE